MRLGDVGLERHRAGKKVGRVGPAKLMGDDAEPMECGEMFRVGGADLPIETFRLRQAAGLMMRPRLRESLIERLSGTGIHRLNDALN